MSKIQAEARASGRFGSLSLFLCSAFVTSPLPAGVRTCEPPVQSRVAMIAPTTTDVLTKHNHEDERRRRLFTEMLRSCTTAVSTNLRLIRSWRKRFGPCYLLRGINCGSLGRPREVKKVPVGPDASVSMRWYEYAAQISDRRILFVLFAKQARILDLTTRRVSRILSRWLQNADRHALWCSYLGESHDSGEERRPWRCLSPHLASLSLLHNAIIAATGRTGSTVQCSGCEDAVTKPRLCSSGHRRLHNP
jgi:hypothetical protein